jgi:MFS superfamily sulfate permease-like transporter
MKQFPHLIGRDKDFEGDESFFQVDNENTFSEILIAMQNFTPGCAIIGITCIIILLLWETKWMKQTKIGQLMPAALIVVVVGSLIADYFESIYPSLSLSTEHLVHLPTSQAELNNAITFPFFEAISNYQIWIIALKLAIVASLETLLGIEAVDKLDPQRRISPPNRELIAQGAGNIVSGFFGGLPVTSVIVRSSANVTANAQTKVSTILHGLMLLFAVMLFPNVINKIPLSSLAAILIYTGYKLTKLNMFKEFYKKGWDQFVPFIVTIIAILLSDLLIGIMIGIGVGLFYMIRSNFRSSVLIVNDKHHYLIRLRKDVSFLNKPILKHRLSNIPENSILFIDATRADFIDKDIIDEINNFMLAAPAKNIKVEIKKSIHKPLHSLFNQL